MKYRAVFEHCHTIASEFQDITLTVKGKVSEQFNLTPGTTYWFDLSSAGIPGSTNNALPDTSRHYVPFTYVGSLNAYVLKPASENVLTSSEEASQATDKDAKYGYTSSTVCSLPTIM